MNATVGLTLAGDVILAATMVVFMLQIRWMARSTRSGVYQTVADQMMSIDRLFVGPPRIAPVLLRERTTTLRSIRSRACHGRHRVVR